MFPDLRIRSNASEAMDNFDLRSEELRKALDKIAQINRLLGGNAATISAVMPILTSMNPNRRIRITDLGCGNGDMLRILSRRAKLMNRELQLQGIDANAFTVAHAATLSRLYPDIRYTCADMLDENYIPGSCDIVLCTLTLHHFSDQQITQLLNKMAGTGARAIVINDLHRSRTAYLLFGWASRLLGLNKMNIEDGKLSIIKGFRRKELEHLASQLHFKKHRIRWKWAFRYQWIITSL